MSSMAPSSETQPEIHRTETRLETHRNRVDFAELPSSVPVLKSFSEQRFHQAGEQLTGEIR